MRRAAHAALAVATLAFVAHRALAPMAETDLFFHLKLGQLILERHAIPFRNLFSFTWPDAPDPDLAWAFQVAVALAHRLGGFGAIVLFKVGLVVLAFALVQRACLRAGAAPVPTAIALALAVTTAGPRLVERPHLVTFVGLGALAWLLEARSRRALAWLPLGVVVWANFHAGVFFAPLVLVLATAGARLDGERPARAELMAIGLAAAATFCTPAGARLPSYLLWHTGLGATRVIEEFRHADLWNDPWLFAQGALALGSALATRRARRWLPALVVFALAWRSVRFAAEWAILSAPLCALGLTALVRQIAAPRTLRQFAAPDVPFRETTLRQIAAPAVAALALLAILALERRGQPPPLGLARDVVPFDAIAFVTDHGLRDRLYEDLDVGCYLLWEGWPRFRVFQDARLPAYPDAFHRALDQTPLEPAAFDALLRRYGVDAALLSDPDVNMRAGSFDPDEWALVYRADDAIVYARRTPAHAALIAGAEIPLRARFAFDGGTRWEPIAQPPARSPVDACTWQRRLTAALVEESPPEALVAEARALAAGCFDAREAAEARRHLARSLYGWNARIGR